MNIVKFRFREEFDMRRFHWRMGLAIGLLASGGMVGCQPEAAGDRGGANATQTAVRATVMTPQRKSLVRVVDLPGRVGAYETTPLFAKATGYVVRVPVDVGDSIQAATDANRGTILCELEVPELKEELAQKGALVAQAEAEVLQAEAGIKVAESAVNAANAMVDEAKAAVQRDESMFARWQSEYQRVAQLADSGAVTRKVADETRAQLDAADAGRKEAVAHIASAAAHQQEIVAALEKARADAVAARARLLVAKAEERRMAAMSEYTTIRAPFDGVVVERNVHTGHLVQAGAGQQKPLLVVMRTDPVRVTIDVPESDAVHVTSETKVDLKIPSLPGSSFVGKVTRSSWSLNSSSRTMAAEVHVANAAGTWRPGQYIQAKLTVAELENRLSLPKSAIITQDKQTFCMAVAEDGTVQRLPIRLGLEAGGDFEVLEGLSGTERVISTNANSFREGQKVEIAPPSK